jgi:hypothetical protein
MKVAVEMGGWHAPGVVYRASESHRAQLALQLLDLLRCALPHALGCPGRSAGLLRYTRLFQQLPIKAPSLEVLLAGTMYNFENYIWYNFQNTRLCWI